MIRDSRPREQLPPATEARHPHPAQPAAIVPPFAFHPKRRRHHRPVDDLPVVVQWVEMWKATTLSLSLPNCDSSRSGWGELTRPAAQTQLSDRETLLLTAVMVHGGAIYRSRTPLASQDQSRGGQGSADQRSLPADAVEIGLHVSLHVRVRKFGEILG